MIQALNYSVPFLLIRGIPFCVMNKAKTIEYLFSALKEMKKKNACEFVCVSNLYDVSLVGRKKISTSFYNDALLVVPDGMPIAWLAKLFAKISMQRIRGMDLMLKVIQKGSKRGLSNLFLGASPLVLEKLEAKLRAQNRNIRIDLNALSYYKKLKDIPYKEIAKMIKKRKPDICWIGLGGEKQIEFMYKIKRELSGVGCLLIGVGAAFDFIAGTKRVCPQFLQVVGLEWLFRLLHEPRRLFSRYVFGNIPTFIKIIFGLNGQAVSRKINYKEGRYFEKA